MPETGHFFAEWESYKHDDKSLVIIGNLSRCCNLKSCQIPSSSNELAADLTKRSVKCTSQIPEYVSTMSLKTGSFS